MKRVLQTVQAEHGMWLHQPTVQAGHGLGLPLPPLTCVCPACEPSRYSDEQLRHYGFIEGECECTLCSDNRRARTQGGGTRERV